MLCGLTAKKAYVSITIDDKVNIMELEVTANNLKTNQVEELTYEFDFGPLSMLYLNKLPLYTGVNEKLLDFVRLSYERPYSVWIHDFRKLISNRSYNFASSIQLMMFRSFCVLLRPMNLYHSFIENENHVNLDGLYNEFYLDWTGRTGTQPLIYFPPQTVYAEEPTLSKLFSLQLLFKLSTHFKTRQNGTFYFMPFNIPKIDRNVLGTSMAVWMQILNAREIAIKRFTDRHA